LNYKIPLLFFTKLKALVSVIGTSLVWIGSFLHEEKMNTAINVK